jgi:hypothetical protein
MLPIERFVTTQEKQKDGALYIRGRFTHERTAMVSANDQDMDETANRLKDKMRQDFWENTYGDLREPLYELMLLAKRAANANPAAYVEGARIEQLIEELHDLLDWRKQMAAAKPKEKSNES